MKQTFFPLFCLALVLCACQPKADSLIGEWKADKVSVQFDERRSTPDMVKQVGELEKHNHFVINNDSSLVFYSLDTKATGRISTDKQGSLFWDCDYFGQWNNGEIVTTTSSPLGEITIVYKKAE
ncbi:MAG: hypothetical protein IJQ11_00865 [Bacteroidales bacterium]|nr:hypothetical protein [Bacteroidales bacterium]